MSIFVSNFNIYNVICTLADTEYSRQLSVSASYFEIKCRQLTSDLKVAFVSGQSGTTYFTLPAGATWFTKGKIAGQKTLYFQSPQAGTVVEITEGV